MGIRPVVGNLGLVVDRHGRPEVDILGLEEGSRPAVAVVRSPHHIGLVVVDRTDLVEDRHYIEVVLRADRSCLAVEVVRRLTRPAYRTSDRCYRAAV